MLRVLFVGENWYGSCARACCYALRRLGCDVRDIDLQTFFPQLRRRSSRLALRAVAPRLVAEFNQHILEVARHFQPDWLLAFKGSYLRAETLRALRHSGIALYNYYPDRMIFARGTPMENAIPEYDCVFDTKRYWDGDTNQHIHPRARVFLPHGYDPEIHRTIALEDRDLSQFGCDVSLVATHMPVKEELVDELLTLHPALDLQIWGGRWENCRSSRVKAHVRGLDVRGLSYAKAVLASRINLAVMGVTPEARDETSTRTYEIPACGGFMLHQRSAEVLDIFSDAKEMATFESAKDLAGKIDYYLAHAEERQRIARAGQQRCVPAYSYDNRMAEVLAYHARKLAGIEDGAVQDLGRPAALLK